MSQKYSVNQHLTETVLSWVKSGEIAIPDVNRSWKLPDTDGHVLDLTLPFLMKHDEQRSIGGYLFEYFKGHQDVSHGLFSTGDLQVAFVCPVLCTEGDSNTGCEKSNCVHVACLRPDSANMA